MLAEPTLVVVDDRSGLRIAKHSKYQSVLQLGRDRRGALLLDLGCCC
jgi:hypothetical protein